MSDAKPIGDRTDPQAARRRWFGPTASLAAHAGVVCLIALLAREPTIPAHIDATVVEIVDPPPAPTVEPPTLDVPSGTVGTLGRRGHDAPRRHAPAAAADPRAEVTVSYDEPTSDDPGNPAGDVGSTYGAGHLGDGLGAGYGQRGAGYGIGALHVPLPPPPEKSLARPPRPRQPYSKWAYFAPPAFGGQKILLELTIDPDGEVQHVRLLHGVDYTLDKQAIDTVRHFHFYPALKATGDPTWGLHRWEFELVSSESSSRFHFR